MTKTDCAKNQSIYTFDASIAPTAGLFPSLPATIPTQTQPDYVNGLNLFPVYQGKYAKAVCVDTSGNVSRCAFPNAVQIQKNGLYRIKFEADVSTSTILLGSQGILAVLGINGVYNMNSYYVTILYLAGQIVHILVELGLELRKNDLVQIVISDIGSTPFNLQITNSTLEIANINKLRKDYAEFNTTFGLTQSQLVKIPFSSLIPNPFAKISSLDNTILKLNLAGTYKCHFYWDLLTTPGLATVSFYPFQVAIVLNQKVVETQDGYLLSSQGMPPSFTNTGHFFFDLDVTTRSNLQIVINSPAILLYSINILNSLFEIVHVESELSSDSAGGIEC